MGGIRRRQALGHVARVARAVGQVLPRVRIGVAVVMMVPALVAIGIAFAMVVVVVVAMIMPAAGELARRHAFGRHHLPAGEARSLVQPRQPGLEVQAIDDQQLRASQLPGIRGRGLVFVGVAIGTDQRAHAHILSANLAHDVAQDGKAGHHLQRFGRVGRRQGGGQAQASGGRRRRGAEMKSFMADLRKNQARPARRAQQPPRGPPTMERR